MTWTAGQTPTIEVESGGFVVSFFAEVADTSDAAPAAERWAWRVQATCPEAWAGETTIVEASCGSEGRAMFAATLALTAVTLT